MTFTPNEKVVFNKDVMSGDAVLAKNGDKGVVQVVDDANIIVQLYPLENNVTITVDPADIDPA